MLSGYSPRFAITVGSVILMLLVTTASAAKEAEFQVLTGFPENSKPQRILTRSAKRVTKKTNRAVELRYVSSSVNSGAELLQEFLGDSALDAALLPGSSLDQLMPNATLYGQAFLFRDDREVEFLRDRLDDEFIAALHTDEIMAVGLSGLGFFYLMGPDFESGAAGLAGKTVWMPFESQYTASVLDHLSIKTINSNTLRIDAVPTDLPDYIIHNPTALILNKKFPRPNLMLEPPLHYAYLILVVKRVVWDGLEAGNREMLAAHFNKQMRDIETKALSAESRSRNLLMRRGLSTVGLDVEELERLGELGESREIDPSLLGLLNDALEEYRSD
jgi:TRAP-type C4-dicarboxylate transport system substrate-binding protein